MKRILFCVFIWTAVIAGAQTYRGGEIFRIGNSDIYWAAVKTSYFKEYVATQEEDCWCWAACVQMVLNYQGVNVTQEDLVRRVKGVRVNQGGNGYDMQKAADGWRTGDKIIGARVESPYGLTAQSLINDLINKYPLIVGLTNPGASMGHAYVLTGISFRMVNGGYSPVEVILRNPWPSSPSREKMSWSEFKSKLNTVVHVYPK